MKLEIPFYEDVTVNADPDEVARLLAMIQEIQIPSEAIFEESHKQYKWHQVMKVSVYSFRTPKQKEYEHLNQHN